MNTISLIGCIVGIIGCAIGVATFVSAKLTNARDEGKTIAMLEQCVKGIDEIKQEMKEKNKMVDSVLDEHTREITQLQTQVESIFKQLEA